MNTEIDLDDRITPQMQSITYEESIKFGGGVVSYDHVTDEDITESLTLPNKEMDRDTSSIVYHVRLLTMGEVLNPFEVIYEREEEFPHWPVIYDGWHRIRAYQYLKYTNIPCIIEKQYM